MKTFKQITDKNKEKYGHYRLKGKTEYFSHKITPKSYYEDILTQKGGVYKIRIKYLYH